MDEQLSRRQFFRLRPTTILRTAVTGSEGDRGRGDARRADPIRPPGALPEAEFRSTCERCGACRSACPYGVIHKLGPEAGTAEGTPFLEPEKEPCRWCPSMDCVHACPSGALRMEDGELPGPIAVAEIDMESCLVRQGTLCDTCVVHCPSHVGAITRRGREPLFNPTKCVGCGMCAYMCEARPSAYRIRPL